MFDTTSTSRWRGVIVDLSQVLHMLTLLSSLPSCVIFVTESSLILSLRPTIKTLSVRKRRNCSNAPEFLNLNEIFRRQLVTLQKYFPVVSILLTSFRNLLNA